QYRQDFGILMKDCIAKARRVGNVGTEIAKLQESPRRANSSGNVIPYDNDVVKAWLVGTSVPSKPAFIAFKKWINASEDPVLEAELDERYKKASYEPYKAKCDLSEQLLDILGVNQRQFFIECAKAQGIDWKEDREKYDLKVSSNYYPSMFRTLPMNPDRLELIGKVLRESYGWSVPEITKLKKNYEDIEESIKTSRTPDEFMLTLRSFMRDEMDMNLSQLGRSIGVSQSAASLWVNGKQRPTLERIHQIEGLLPQGQPKPILSDLYWMEQRNVAEEEWAREGVA
ncbi:MAG: helix-turn-helix domain-containing protein, partial [Rickettsiales bacterium]